MTIRRAVVRAAVAVGVAGAVLSPAGSAFADAAAPAAASKYYYNTWITADSYSWVGNGHPHWLPTGGKLFAGRNYFYCQNDWGQRYTDKWGNTNTWWAQTDDDSVSSLPGLGGRCRSTHLLPRRIHGVLTSAFGSAGTRRR